MEYSDEIEESRVARHTWKTVSQAYGALRGSIGDPELEQACRAIISSEESPAVLHDE